MANVPGSVLLQGNEYHTSVSKVVDNVMDLNTLNPEEEVIMPLAMVSLPITGAVHTSRTKAKPSNILLCFCVVPCCESLV